MRNLTVFTRRGPVRNALVMLGLSGLVYLGGCAAPAPTELPEAVQSAPEVQQPSGAVEVVAPTETETAVPVIDIAGLAMKIDPVCKMSLEEYPAVASATHEDKSYGFCSDFCKRKFEEAPAKILARFTTVSEESVPAE